MKCPICQDDYARLAKIWARIQDAKTRGEESPFFKNAPSWFLESLEAPLEVATDYTLEEMEEHLTDDHDMDQDEREQIGEYFSNLVQAQIDLEIQEKVFHRIAVTRTIIATIRKDKRHWPSPKMASKALSAMISETSLAKRTWQTWPLTYGFYGLLDFIESGKTAKILDPTLRRAVQIALLNQE